MRHYVYQHRQLDTNEVFYVGIGTKTPDDYKYNRYNRAYSKSGRNTGWFDIVNSVGYSVQILFQSDDYSKVKTIETELIRLHGRKDIDFGNLVNLTNGAEGNYDLSEESVLNLILSKKNRKICWLYDLKGNFIREYPSMKQVSKDLKLPPHFIKDVCNGKLFTVNKKYTVCYALNNINKYTYGFELVPRILKIKSEKNKQRLQKSSKSLGAIVVIRLNIKNNTEVMYNSLREAGRNNYMSAKGITSYIRNNKIYNNIYYFKEKGII